jgi:hypothetical protein
MLECYVQDPYSYGRTSVKDIQQAKNYLTNEEVSFVILR